MIHTPLIILKRPLRDFQNGTKDRESVVIAAGHLAWELATLLHLRESGKEEHETDMQTQQRPEIHREASGRSGVPGSFRLFSGSNKTLQV